MEKTKARILLIDDEPDILECLTFLMEDFEVDTACNGEEALKKLMTQKYDGAVCDWLMPKMDGITLLKELRKQKNYIPFVFVSGNAGPTQENTMTSLGAFQLLPKDKITEMNDIMKRTLAEYDKIKHLEVPQNNLDEATDDFLKILYSVS